MPQWIVRSPTEVAVVDAPDWLTALPEALVALGIPKAAVPRIAAEESEDGVVRLSVPDGSVCLLARPYPDDAPLPTGVLSGQGIGSGAEGDQGVFSAPHLALLDPYYSRPIPPPPAGLAEKLFEQSRLVLEAETEQAAVALALLVLREAVHAEAASFFNGGPTDSALEVYAANGPCAEAVLGRCVPYGQGVCGHVHDTGIAVLIGDLDQSARHLHYIDAAVGYHPRSLLAVPVRDAEGHTWGVLELLDSRPGFFVDWHVELASEVALVLAQALTRVEGVEALFPEPVGA